MSVSRRVRRAMSIHGDIKLREAATGIKALMDEHKVYKNPHLGLRELSNGLNTPSHIITKAMNEVLGVNFYELVNKYRVEEAKQLLSMIVIRSFVSRAMQDLTRRQHSTQFFDNHSRM